MSESTLLLAIDGMSCQACAARIEKVLNKHDAVHEAAVSFAGESAKIRYDAACISPEQLIDIISKTGFTARPAVLEDVPAPRPRPPVRLLLLWLLTLPFLAGMAGMLAGTHALMPPVEWQLVLATLAQTVFAWPFYRGAWAAWRGGAANMDVLVSAGTLAVYLYSLAGWHTGGAVYFEAGVMVLAFVSLGKFWEEQTKRGSLNSLALLVALAPQSAEVLRDGEWQTLPLADIRTGDTLRAVHGARVAADGVVLSGEAWADESHLTGESRPVSKRAGDRILAGALLSGSLQYRAERLGGDTLLGDMMRALAQAQAGKAPMARLADRAAAVFVPVVGAVAVLVFLVNWLVSGDAGQGVLRAAAVLVAACPCALGLATPAAVMAGMGAAARHGIWFDSPAVLERAGQADTLVLDKTGTLTLGRPRITAVWTAEGITQRQLLQAAASAEQHSLHPYAAAIAAAARAENITPAPATLLHSEAGGGVEAYVANTGRVKAGSLAFCGFRLPEHTAKHPDWREAGIAAFAVDGRVWGAFALSDPVRDDSAAALARLRGMGIALHLSSGDRPETVARTAAVLGIGDFAGAQSPRDKADTVSELMAAGGVVAMAGDGINDAPALAAADVGIAVWGGSAAAAHSAGVRLMRPSAQGLADVFSVARATVGVIRQNLFFAFFYNGLTIPLAAFGLLTPAWAGLAMALSSVSVLANALRLKRFQAA